VQIEKASFCWNQVLKIFTGIISFLFENNKKVRKTVRKAEK